MLKMKKSKLIFLLLVFCLIAGLLSGCGGGGDKASETGISSEPPPLGSQSVVITSATAAPPPAEVPQASPTIEANTKTGDWMDIAITPKQMKVVVIGVLNVRDGPGTEHKQVAALPEGTMITVDHQAGDWYKIAVSGYYVKGGDSNLQEVTTAEPDSNPSADQPDSGETSSQNTTAAATP